MYFSLKRFRLILPYLLKTRKSILIRGKHGIGKSEIVKQIAEEYGYSLLEKFPSQMESGEVSGIPFPNLIGDRKVTSFYPPDWWIECCISPKILFLDEFDRAYPEVRQSFMQATCSREIAGHKLHSESFIIACVNSGNHAVDYQVNTLDPAELDRWFVIDLEPTVEEWLEWGASNVSPLVLNFIKKYPYFLDHKGSYEQDMVYPSRRSWKCFSDILSVNNLQISKNNLDIIDGISESLLGYEVSVAFIDFLKIVLEQNLTDSIINSEEISNIQKIEKIDKLFELNVFKKQLMLNEAQKIVEFLFTCPGEILMNFFHKFSSLKTNEEIKMYNAQILFSICQVNKKTLGKLIAENSFVEKEYLEVETTEYVHE